MPTVPMLPPDQMAQASASAGLNPMQFLIATADMHGSGQLSAPTPASVPLQTGKSPSRKAKIKVVR